MLKKYLILGDLDCVDAMSIFVSVIANYYWYCKPTFIQNMINSQFTNDKIICYHYNNCSQSLCTILLKYKK